MALTPPGDGEGHVASLPPFGQNRLMRVLRSLLVGVTALATLTAVVPSVAHAKPSDGISMPVVCRDSFNTASMREPDVSRVATDRVVVYDGVTVRLDRKGWKTEHPRDPSWVLWFQSLNWLVPLALTDPETAIAVFEERDRFLPDPGATSGREERKGIGWSQGQFRTRLLTATCLYTLTRDDRMIPIAARLAKANADPKRYPGPPRRKVHNHATMSNLALVQAGRTFGRDDWVDIAKSRFALSLPYVFSSCGMAWEQSSAYQQHNVSLWSRAARIMHVDLARPERALGALVRPDGVLEAIGNGQRRLGEIPNGAPLWCSQAGWAAGTLDDSTHFTLRFGPKVAYHGHRDRGSMTWFALGTAVLSDRGLYDKTRDARYDFAHSMAAHSVFEPVGSPKYNPDTSGTRVNDRAFDLRDAADGIERSREVRIGPTRLVVRDRGIGAKEWIQHWQLAPGWEPTQTGAVNEAAGLTLTIDCPRLKPVRVEAVIAWRTAVKAWDLQCHVDADRTGARLTTTLTVAPTP